MKFTSVGSITLDVRRISTIGDRRRIRFSVTDTGIGIPQDRRERLFKAFSQVDSSTTRRFGGTGLGLSICMQLVNLMGGILGVDSQVGVGSTFWFELELDILAESTKSSVSDTTPESQVKGSDSSCTEVQQFSGHVLVAEDNSINQLYIGELLRLFGCTFDIVENGERAIAAVEKHHYQLVLMDCQMPDMDGFAATKVIRDRESTGQFPGHLPIVALTANALKGDREKCLEAGMDDYASKPLEAEQMRQVLNRFLGRPGQTA